MTPHFIEITNQDDSQGGPGWRPGGDSQGGPGWRPGGADPHSEQNGSHPKNPGICFVIGFMRDPK